MNASSLYPFLEERSDAASAGVLVDSVMKKAEDSVAVKRAFFEENAGALVAAAKAIATLYRGGGRLLAMGNGGSSCDAAHFAVEFLHPVTTGRRALAALNLANDMAMATAVANDVGVEHVFARQVAALARRGDGLVGFSTSGNSANLLAAFAQARTMGVARIGFAGGDGGRMAAAGLDHCLVVRTDSIHRVQETHVAAYHILWDLVHALLA